MSSPAGCGGLRQGCRPGRGVEGCGDRNGGRGVGSGRLYLRQRQVLFRGIFARRVGGTRFTCNSSKQCCGVVVYV